MLNFAIIALITAASAVKLGLTFYWTRLVVVESGGRYAFTDVFQSFLPVESNARFDPETARRIAVLKRYENWANLGFIAVTVGLMLVAIQFGG